MKITKKQLDELIDRRVKHILKENAYNSAINNSMRGDINTNNQTASTAISGARTDATNTIQAAKTKYAMAVKQAELAYNNAIQAAKNEYNTAVSGARQTRKDNVSIARDNRVAVNQTARTGAAQAKANFAQNMSTLGSNAYKAAVSK